MMLLVRRKFSKNSAAEVASEEAEQRPEDAMAYSSEGPLGMYLPFPRKKSQSQKERIRPWMDHAPHASLQSNNAVK